MPERPSFEPSEAKDFKIYDRPDEKPYFNKKDHLERSIANDKRKRGHKEHWKKEDKNVREIQETS